MNKKMVEFSNRYLAEMLARQEAVSDGHKRYASRKGSAERQSIARYLRNARIFIGKGATRSKVIAQAKALAKRDLAPRYGVRIRVLAANFIKWAEENG